MHAETIEVLVVLQELFELAGHTLLHTGLLCTDKAFHHHPAESQLIQSAMHTACMARQVPMSCQLLHEHMACSPNRLLMTGHADQSIYKLTGLLCLRRSH